MGADQNFSNGTLAFTDRCPLTFKWQLFQLNLISKLPQEVDAPRTPRGLAEPPTITLRRPSRTCLPSDPSPKCSDQPGSFPGHPLERSRAEEETGGDSTSLICFCGFYSEKSSCLTQHSLSRGRKVSFSIHVTGIQACRPFWISYYSTVG